MPLKFFGDFLDTTELEAKETYAHILKQGLRNSCERLRKRRKLHTSSWNWMQAHGIACKLMELNASSWNCMEAHGPA